MISRRDVEACDTVERPEIEHPWLTPPHVHIPGNPDEAEIEFGGGGVVGRPLQLD